MKGFWTVGGAAALMLGVVVGIRWMRQPHGALPVVRLGADQVVVALPHEGSGPKVALGVTEVTVEAFADFLNRSGHEYPESPQLHRVDGRWLPRVGRTGEPAAYVSLADARAYGRWLSRTGERTVRLPTEAEWERAARAEVPGAPYAWGWEPVSGRADVGSGGLARVRRFAPNRWGFHGFTGGVWEWVEAEASGPDRGVCRGGAWSEREGPLAQVSARTEFPDSYRDGDVGFRVAADLGKPTSSTGPAPRADGSGR